MQPETERQITLDEVRDQLAEQIAQLNDTTLTITDGDRAIGVLLSPEAYARIRRAQAYLQMLAIATNLRESSITVDDLLQASRTELETHGW
jgi:hypothetical protein